MTASRRTRAVAVTVAMIVLTAGLAAQKERVNPDAATIADFKKRVAEYVALSKKLEGTLPALPAKATPQQMDAHERALAELVQKERAGAKQRDILTEPMQRIVRHVLRPVFKGRGGAQVKKEILEEYTEPVTVKVNGRYPDTVPLSTVPPQVLKGLPDLPEELQYRFVGDRLILLDPRAHIIVDYMEHIFP
jgi:hypothetical protein